MLSPTPCACATSCFAGNAWHDAFPRDSVLRITSPLLSCLVVMLIICPPFHTSFQRLARSCAIYTLSQMTRYHGTTNSSSGSGPRSSLTSGTKISNGSSDAAHKVADAANAGVNGADSKENGIKVEAEDITMKGVDAPANEVVDESLLADVTISEAA